MRRVRRLKSFFDRPRNGAARCQPPADGSLVMATISGSVVSGARVTARSRLRSAETEVNALVTAMPAASATEMNTATSVTSISVLDVRDLADDQRSHHLKRHSKPDHAQTERIGREQLQRF